MRKINKEEYLQEIENLKKECDEIITRKREILEKNNYSLDLKYDHTLYINLDDELRKKEKIIEGLNVFLDHVNYENFYNSYHFIEEYFKEKYNDEIELPDFINDKAGFLFRNYVSQKDELPEMECSFHPYVYDDPRFYDSRINEDVEKAKEHFLKEKRHFIYTWEIKYLIPAMYYEKLLGINITNVLFSESHQSVEQELDELKRNFDYIIKRMREEKKFNFSLFLWTIYRIYHYFRKKDSGFIIDRQSFILLDYLLESAFFFFDNYEFDLLEAPITDDEKGFVRHVCGLLSNDLINTISNCFPDYYSTNIMFLGYGCHIPGGCSDLTTNMNTFDSFLKGICDYDFWYDEDISGEDLLLHKLKIQKNYQKLLKKVSNSETK